MAPRRRKAGARAGEKEGFRVGDLVLAKVKGFAAWPAKISRPEDWKRLPDPKKYFVRFFGTSEIGFVAASNIKSFTIELKTELTGRPRIKQSKDFARAVEEICEAFEELQSKSSEQVIEQPKAPPDDSEASELPIEARSPETETVGSSPGLEDKNSSLKECALDESIENSIVTKAKDAGTTLMDSLSVQDKKKSDLVKKKAVQVRRRERKVSARVTTKTSAETKEKDGQTSLKPENSTTLEVDPKGTSPIGSSSVKEEKTDDHVELKTVQGPRRKRKVSSEVPAEADVKNRVEDARPTFKSESSSTPKENGLKGTNFMDSSSVKLKKRDDLVDEKTVPLRRRKRMVSTEVPVETSVETTEKNVGASVKSETSTAPEGGPVGTNLIDLPSAKDDKRDDLVGEKTVKVRQRNKKLTAEVPSETSVETKGKEVEPSLKSESSSSSQVGIKGPNPTVLLSVKEEKREDLVDEKSYQIRQRKRKTFAGGHIETSLDTKEEDGGSNHESESSTSSEDGCRGANLMDSSPVKSGKRDDLVEEEYLRSRQTKKKVSAMDSKLHVRKRERNASASDAMQKSKRRVSKINEKNQSKDTSIEKKELKDKSGIDLTKTVEDEETVKDVPGSLSKKSPCTRRRILRIVDDENDEEASKVPVLATDEVGETEIVSNVSLMTKAMLTSESQGASPNKNTFQTVGEKKVGECADSQEFAKMSASQDLRTKKLDLTAANKTKTSAKAPTKITDNVLKRSNVASTSLPVRPKTKPFAPINEKQQEKLPPKDSKNTNRFDPLQDHHIISGALKSRFANSSTSMKDLIAVAQAKRKESHSVGVFHDNFSASTVSFHATAVRERSPSPLIVTSVLPPVINAHNDTREVYGSLSPTENIVAKSSPQTSDVKQLEIDGDHAEAVAAREAFEAMIDSLCRTKDSIGRATHQAIECAKYNMANEIVDLLIRRLETEISFRRKVDLFFLVDSITQCSHSRRGVAGASYVPSVQASMSRLLSAAAPPGAGACENRHQCLKVLKLWLERKIFPESVIRPIIDGIEVPIDDPSSGLYLRRRARTERSIDDPIREMEGMLVDEYGSNVTFQLPGLLSIHDSEDEEDDVSRELCDDSKDESGVDLVSPLDERNILPGTPSKRQHHLLEDVDGELEMEELEEKNKFSDVADVPLPNTAPLPSCPPPSPPPPPPSSPPPQPPPPPLQLPPQPSFVPPLPPNPPPAAYQASANLPYPSTVPQDHFRPANGHNPPFMMPGVGPGQLPSGNVRPCDYVQEGHLPLHAYHSNTQYQPVAAQPIPQIPFPPSHVIQQPPPHHPNVIPQPPPPANFQYQAMPGTQYHAQGHNGPYFLPPHPTGQTTQVAAYPGNAGSDGQHGSWAHGWRPGLPPGGPLAQDGHFNLNMERPAHGFQPPVGLVVGSIAVPLAQGGPQIFPYRPDAPPLNCWRPS